MGEGTLLGRQVVVLMRHAEAGEAAEGGSDFERTLTRRGEADAEAVARRLAAGGWTPMRALCSAAWRTRQTFSIVSRVWGGAVEVAYRDDLYLAEPEAIAVAVHEAIAGESTNGQGVSRALLLVGHNPGIEALASRWAEKVLPMPTAAAVVFAFESERTEDAGGRGNGAGVGDCAEVQILRMVDRVLPGEARGR